MKKYFAYLAIAILAITSVFMVYQDLQASIIPCLMAQTYCLTSCYGLFSLGDCWESEGTTYCWFTCSRILIPCGWQNPTTTQCQGDM